MAAQIEQRYKKGQSLEEYLNTVIWARVHGARLHRGGTLASPPPIFNRTKRRCWRRSSVRHLLMRPASDLRVR